MGRRTAGTRGWWGYVAVTVSVTAVHPLLPADARAWSYLLIPLSALASVIMLLRRQDPRDRLPWRLLVLGLCLLSSAEALTKAGGPAQHGYAELLDTFGQVGLLSAAIALAWRRGRNDIGGLLDVSVGAMGVSGLFWTTVLLPRLHALDADSGALVTLLLSILVLMGVLGALVRIMLVSDRRLPALTMLAGSLLLALVGNIILGMTVATITTKTSAWLEMVFMVSYLLVGAAALHPSVRELSRPGPEPEDRLSTGRLIFLGAAIVVGPVAGGVRELADLPADGSLLALGSLLVAPLVMIRVGRLAHQRRQAEAALHHQATHDQLTGLPNRTALLDRLDAALQRERTAGRPAVVLLFCDLNGFKAVNDRLGHLAGDHLLTEVGRRIRAGMRVGDTLARYGGDEFLVLCEEPAQHQAVVRLCAHISDALNEPFLLAGEMVAIGSSVGAVISDGHSHADELITRADQQMYRAKQEHKAALWAAKEEVVARAKASLVEV
ncbi:MAG TPA: GGDEF domain-containing protein [Micromonosporaceae bacterium]|nr:GGDEF domain-containing protein [Micromonosporaceae bacterium]